MNNTDTKTRWSDLRTRLEAAEGPDRELDARIYCCQRDARFFGLDPFMMRSRGAIDPHIVGLQAVPRYTASMDTALSWVPEGWAWMVQRVGIPGSLPAADLWLPAQRTLGLATERVRVEAATPAIALCIAIARAMEAMES